MRIPQSPGFCFVIPWNRDSCSQTDKEGQDEGVRRAGGKEVTAVPPSITSCSCRVGTSLSARLRRAGATRDAKHIMPRLHIT